MLPFTKMSEQMTTSISPPDILRLHNGILEQWQQLALEQQAILAPILLHQLLQSEHGPQALAAIQALAPKFSPETHPVSPETPPNTWFEQYFEERLAQLEVVLERWAVRAFHLEDKLTLDEIMQSIRVILWRRFSENPEEWATKPQNKWLAYAKETYRWKVVGFHRDGERKLGLVASDMEAIVNEQDINDDEALSMLAIAQSISGGQFAYPHETVLTDLRIDLQRALARGLERLCASQRRDMPKLISDILEGYILEETCERYDWTRNRGVTLMRKLRTIFYEELTGKKKEGYLGSHHPLSEAEKQRIRTLHEKGLSYRKIAALVGRSPSSVEALCKKYPPELVSHVHKLRAQGLSHSAIAKHIGRGKSYVGWLLAATLEKSIDKVLSQEDATTLSVKSL
jgi:hypothetical protein